MSYLDYMASALCAVLAACTFGIHAMSSRRRGSWMSLPEYVRRGLLVTGIMFTWRAVDFASLAPRAYITVGHINTEGMMALAAMAYTVCAVTFCVARRTLRRHGWQRVEFAEQAERADPTLAPVMMKPHEVLETLERNGVYVVDKQPRAARR